MSTTGPITIDEENHKGTYQMRALIRYVALRSSRLWHRNKGLSKQSLFMPQDLHITHIVLYAVRPELVHENLLYQEPLKEKFLYVDHSWGGFP